MNEPLSPNARIRIKSIYPVYRLSDTRFRIGAQRGLTADMTDPHSHLWTLVKHLDGRTPLSEVVARVRATFPDVSHDDVLGAIRALNAEGLVEDATPTAYELNDTLSRYTGNINYFSHYATLSSGREEPQDRLRKTRCVLFGLGGGGSYILPFLLSAGFGEIVAVDYDKVELTNLNRQLLYRESDIGELKTTVAARIAHELNSQVKFTAVQEKIESPRQVAELVHGADIAFCAIDEPPFVAQRRVNAGCVAEAVPYVCGGSFINRGRVFTIQPGESGCLDCLHIYYTRNDPLYLTQLKAALDLEFEPVTVAFAPYIAMVVSLMVAEAVRLVTRHSELLSLATQLEVHYETGTLEPATSWPPAAGCPTCGDGADAHMFDAWGGV